MIYVLSCKNAETLKRAKDPANKNARAEAITEFAPGQKMKKGDQVYLDLSALSPDELKKVLRLLKKGDWVLEQPAANGFGAGTDKAAGKTAGMSASGAEKKKDQKLPSGKFAGWKTIRAGTTETFFFLYVSLAGKSDIRSAIGEKAFNTTKIRLREVLQHGLHEAEALLWMETENDSLFLIPARLPNVRAAVEASFRMILNSRLIGIEKLGLSFYADFTFAMHYGKTVFQAPGKTGAVISESVNYIFHLGAKKAETGRLTLSDDVPEEAVPEGLADLFTAAGTFEGIPIRHSKRFVYL